jgi:dTDP-4-amino-4,6-dideoxygalactose transaminase
MSYKKWPLGKLPKELQRPEFEQLRELGYEWVDPWDIVEIFEQEIADFAGSKYAVTVDSATNGLFLCLKYYWDQFYGMRNFPQTIKIPSRTYCSVPMTIINAGHKVEFEDIEWNGVYQLKPYSIYDGSVRWTEGMYMADDGFQVVSFQIKKRLPIGKGGIILTNNKSAVKWLKSMRYEGRHKEIMYEEDEFEYIGYNMYMTPEDAARGLILFNNLPKINEDSANSESYTDLSKQKIFQL